jgi:hypothetical protein
MNEERYRLPAKKHITAALEKLKNSFESLCDDDLKERATAYDAIGRYHGFINLNNYPLSITRTEAYERYAEELKKEKQ